MIARGDRIPPELLRLLSVAERFLKIRKPKAAIGELRQAVRAARLSLKS